MPTLSLFSPCLIINLYSVSLFCVEMYRSFQSTHKIPILREVMPSNFSLPSYRPRAHTYGHGEQRAHRRWLGALRLEAAICQLKLVCHSNPNSLQPFQSVPPQVGTSGRAAITLHTRSYYSCLPIHLILALFVKPQHLFFSSLPIWSKFDPSFLLHNTIFSPF